MVHVELQDITITYRGTDVDPVRAGKPALDGVSMTIEEGETVSVVGPSGCGKSTLLKIVAGLEVPDRGQVIYNGHDVTRIEPQKRGVGMVFQDYALYPSMRSKGNLHYYFEVRSRTQEEMEQRVKEVANIMGVGFELLLGQLSTTLSGGEQQRVAIARCIVREPTVFLMDEPICNLDAKLRERTRIEMKKMLRKFSISTLYVTHDQQEAIFMGDRIAVMREGKLEQLGTFDELYYTPANLFVATFIGAPPMSVLPADITDGVISFGPDMRIEIPDYQRDNMPQGEVRFGVRPEGWQIETDMRQGITMKVTLIERIPTERASFVRGTIGESRVTVLAPLDQPDADFINISPQWDQVYVFSRADEAALYVPEVPELF